MRPIPSKPVELIEPDPKREGAVRVVVGGRTVLIVPAAAADDEKLAVGRVLATDQVERLERASDQEAAYRTAIRCLERRPFAKRDLARRLALKGHAPEPVAAALEQVEGAGLLDDQKFAEFYVRSRGAKGRGPARLRRELAQMGVDRGVIESALAQDVEVASMGDRLEAMVSKRAGQLEGLPLDQIRRRLLAFLARRGFRGPEVTRVVRAVVTGASASGGAGG